VRKTTAASLTGLLVATAVWYAVTRLPQDTGIRPRPRPTPSPVTGPRGAAPAPIRVATSPRAGWDSVPPLGGVCGGHCGTERWTVKTLSDADRGAVNLRPLDATVEQLVTLQPEGLAPAGVRYVPEEVTTYRVEGYLAAAYPESDGDWHVVVFGKENQRVSLIAEIPDPSCSGACRSGLSDAFAAARRLLEDRLAQPNPKDEPIVVRVTGIGFFDREHGQAGAAPNGFELHPVLKLEFPK
jgi:hypothetical protein